MISAGLSISFAVRRTLASERHVNVSHSVELEPIQSAVCELFLHSQGFCARIVFVKLKSLSLHSFVSAEYLYFFIREVSY